MTPFGIFRRKPFFGTATPLRARLLMACAVLFLAAPAAHVQGSRKDDIAFGTNGRPIAGATVVICVSGATGTPCSPLATLYTDATLTLPSANPLQADGLGNYHFYAAPGRYVVQVSGAGINTYTMNDTILPNDPTTPSFNSTAATSITLGKSLDVGGNTSVTGKLSAGTFAPSSLSTGSLQVSGDARTKGPRPWVDVVAYGADPSGAIDSTAAIQAAINEACSSSVAGGGAVHFPPGTYKVSQPQIPSTSSVLSVPSTCAGLTLEGGSSHSAAGTQFARPPQTAISVSAGANPNLMPVLMLNQTISGDQPTTLRDLQIGGYNQAIQLNSTTLVTFDNVCLSVTNTGHGIRTDATDNTDNTPLAIYNSFTVTYRGGCLVVGSGSSTTPIGVFAFLAQAPPNLGLFQFRDIIGSGGGFIWDCRGTSSDNNCPNGGGNVFFDNVYIENATMPFYTINDTAGTSANVGGTPVYFNNDALYDCTGHDFMAFNGSILGYQNGPSGVWMNNVTPCPEGTPLRVGPGTTYAYNIQGALPLNSSGTPTGNAHMPTLNGEVFLSSNYSNYENNTKIVDSGGAVGAPVMFARSGNTQASLGISPYYGYEFGDGTHYGYETSIARNPAGTLEIQMACAIAPTGLTATPTTGGSLTPQTYYYSIQSVCANGGKKSAGSSEVSITLSGSNNAVSLAWTAPAGTNPGSCNIYRSKSSGGTFSSTTYYTISNCTNTTSFTDIGADGSHGANQLWNASLGAYYRFAPSSANPSGGTVEIGLSGMTGFIGGSALSVGQCTSGNASVTNAATSMPVAVSPSTWPGDGFSIYAYVSASGTVTVKVCAFVPGTPRAVKYSVRVLQ